MLQINLSDIKSHAKQLESAINNYEENGMTILQEVQNSEPNWHDDNSESFFALITKLKSEVRTFNEQLANIKKTYEQIEQSGKKIISFANDIFFDQTQQTNIKTAYENTIRQLTNAKTVLDGANYSFCTGTEQSLIRNAKSKLSTSIKTLETSRDKIDKLFNKLKEYESEITSLMGKIELAAISEIDYSKYL